MAHITGTSFVLAGLQDRIYSVATATTANLGGTQFIYVSHNYSAQSRLDVYSVNAAGQPTFEGTIGDEVSTALVGAWDVETFTIGAKTYLAVVGQIDDGISIFEASATSPFLQHVDTVFDSDDVSYQLDGARFLAVHQIEGNTYITVTSRNWQATSYDTGVTVFSVANDGSLSLADTLSASDVSGTGARAGVPSTTFELNGTYYFAMGNAYGLRFSIMSIDPATGELTFAVPDAGSDQGNFRSGQIATKVIDGVPYLFVPGHDTKSLYVYTYDGGSDVSFVSSITLPTQLDFPEVSAVYEAGDKTLVVIGDLKKIGGITIFDFDTTTGTLSELQWLPGPDSGEPNAQPLQDLFVSPQFTLDGQPYGLIISDDDASLYVYAIGGGDDVLVGTADADLIEGFGGNDSLTGLEGNDELQGFDGNDSLFGNLGNDTLFGGSGDDHMEGGSGDDLMNGGDDNDTMLGFADADSMFGGAGNDIVKGGAGADLIRGNDGDDELVGGSGHDDLGGQLGNDFINAGAGNDLVAGNGGNDRMFGGLGNDTMDGGTGDDLIKGNEGNDTLNGDAGHDTLAGQEGDDILNGGAGNDVIQGGSGQDQINGGDGNDLLTGGSAADVFIFDTVATGGGGFNRITDFTDGVDLIDLTSYAYADANTALSGAGQAGADVNLTLSDGQVVWIENMLLGDLDGSDLIL